VTDRQDLPTAEPAAEEPGPRFVLRLYVTGGSARSVWAIRNVRRFCEERLAGLSDLAIIDIYQQPALAREAELVAAPTLVKELPPPRRRFVGTMRDLGPILADFGLESTPAVKTDPSPGADEEAPL
jgi:circadian clock protein KaiB